MFQAKSDAFSRWVCCNQTAFKKKSTQGPQVRLANGFQIHYNNTGLDTITDTVNP